MSHTVYANGDGLFHKGSGGSGKAFPDICLSPPPAPTGPIPVPYPNIAQASDLAEGSSTVKVNGEPTALEDSSYVSTSTGDEAGNQGGNVVTHKTKGKGYFSLWSFDVKVEGKGVGRHSDPMAQNCGSPPPGGLTPAALVDAAVAESGAAECDKPYSKAERFGTPTDKQKDAVNTANAECWECGSPSARGWKTPPKKGPPPVPGVPLVNPKRKGGKKRRFVADHDPPVLVAYYAGMCNEDESTRKKNAQDTKTVKAHCAKCSSSQGGYMSNYSRVLRSAHGL